SARRTFAAALYRAKLHRESRHLHHIDGIVEDGDPAVADEPPRLCQGFIIERQMKHRWREIGAQWAPHLHRAHGAPTLGATAHVVHQLAERDAETDLEQAAILDV